MNIYEFFDRPEELNGYESCQTFVPTLIMEHIRAFDLKERCPSFEKVLAKKASTAIEYALFIGERFYEGEPTILKNGRAIYLYARDVIKGAWPEGELMISKDATHSYFYAKDVLDRQRFYLGEPTIAKNGKVAFSYAKNIIGGRFPEAEPTFKRMKSDPNFDFIFNEYQTKFNVQL